VLIERRRGAHEYTEEPGAMQSAAHAGLRHNAATIAFSLVLITVP
jgi:hypothetical protein